MPKPDLAIRVENVVATGTLKNELDLQAIRRAFPDSEFKLKFPGLIYRMKKPKISFLLFRTGKIVCVGADSERKVKIAFRELSRKLEQSSIQILCKPEIQIKNVVATANLGGLVEFDKLCEVAENMRWKVMYEPDQFPGLIYRMENPKCVLLVFSNGKIVCVGARTEHEAYDAIFNLRQQLIENKLILY